MGGMGTAEWGWGERQRLNFCHLLSLNQVLMDTGGVYAALSL